MHIYRICGSATCHLYRCDSEAAYGRNTGYMDGHGSAGVTYGEVRNQVERFANHFQKTIGEDSKYVGLLLENCPEWVSSFYGLLMAGYIPVLLSTAASNEENIEILEQLHCKFAVSNKDIAIKTINPFEISEERSISIDNLKWEDGVVLVTSGTSGKSKIYLYTGKELSNQLLEDPGIAHKRSVAIQKVTRYARSAP